MFLVTIIKLHDRTKVYLMSKFNIKSEHLTKMVAIVQFCDVLRRLFLAVPNSLYSFACRFHHIPLCWDPDETEHLIVSLFSFCFGSVFVHRTVWSF